MKSPGSLYVFEGPDGVGKTTLSKWFAGILRKQGVRRVVWSSFPGSERGSVGNLVYRLHHDPVALGVRTIRPLSLQLCHVAAHIDAIESRFMRHICDGATIILDRFWWSTWVYGRVAGADTSTLEAMISIEKRVWQRIVPAKLFLVTRPTSKGSSMHQRLQKLYAHLARREAHSVSVVYIRNNGPLEVAQNQILSSL